MLDPGCQMGPVWPDEAQRCCGEGEARRLSLVPGKESPPVLRKLNSAESRVAESC